MYKLSHINTETPERIHQFSPPLQIKHFGWGHFPFDNTEIDTHRNEIIKHWCTLLDFLITPYVCMDQKLITGKIIKPLLSIFTFFKLNYRLRRKQINFLKYLNTENICEVRKKLCIPVGCVRRYVYYWRAHCIHKQIPGVPIWTSGVWIKIKLSQPS